MDALVRALILERNKKASRRLVRYFMCAGYQVMAVDDETGRQPVLGQLIPEVVGMAR